VNEERTFRSIRYCTYSRSAYEL